MSQNNWKDTDKELEDDYNELEADSKLGSDILLDDDDEDVLNEDEDDDDEDEDEDKESF